MRPIRTSIDKNSNQYRDNEAVMRALVEDLHARMEESRSQGKDRHIAKARAQGKLLARERLELCLDRDSPFLELLPLAGLGGKGFGTGGTTVGGIGLVSGRLCMLISNVGTNKGGAVDYATLQKGLRLSEIAMENALPVINLVESAGANLPEQHTIFNYGGASFREITRRIEGRLADDLGGLRQCYRRRGLCAGNVRLCRFR